MNFHVGTLMWVDNVAMLMITRVDNVDNIATLMITRVDNFDNVATLMIMIGGSGSN